VKPRSLKVIGATERMPFVTVFVSDGIPGDKQQKLLKTLLEIKSEPKFLKVMETRDGFKRLKEHSEPVKSHAAMDWPDWRGPNRDGRVPRLPVVLPKAAEVVWKKGAVPGGLSGLSVCQGKLLVAERDFADENDVYRCLNATNGELLWSQEFPAAGKLDYGNFPRATPVLADNRVYLLGAFGELRCVHLATGKVFWKRDLPREFKAALPTWGMCSTPLLAEGLLIVNPGGKEASLVALDRVTGRTVWTSPGSPAAYSGFITVDCEGKQQIVGYDRISLGGWDLKTGRRLWQILPPREGDFNVPTPLAVNGGILVSTENNGTRVYRFDAAGIPAAQPTAQFADLAPATTTPVTTCGRVFGAHQGLYCLDLKRGLSPVWHRSEDVGDHATFFADDERVLVVTLSGELILLDARANDCTVLSRLHIFDEDVEVYSHPALVGTRMYVRGGDRILCVELGVEEPMAGSGEGLAQARGARG
jgi:PQQ-like domain